MKNTKTLSNDFTDPPYCELAPLALFWKSHLSLPVLFDYNDALPEGGRR